MPPKSKNNVDLDDESVCGKGGKAPLAKKKTHTKIKTSQLLPNVQLASLSKKSFVKKEHTESSKMSIDQISTLDAGDKKQGGTKRKKTGGLMPGKRFKSEPDNNVSTVNDACKNKSLGGFKKEDYLADFENLDYNVARNLVQLFDENNTIPFIARYRQFLTNGMDAERLRHVKQAYDNAEQIISKAEKLLTLLKKEGVDDPNLTARIVKARNVDELDLLAAPFKKGSKATLAARAREAGLEEPGLAVLYGTKVILPSALVDAVIPGREDVAKVRQGLQHIIADVIAKDSELLEYTELLKKRERIMLEVTARKGSEVQATKDKYDLYKQFCEDVRYVKDHQVLAINRGEDQKVLSVKVTIPDGMWEKVKEFCQRRWLSKGFSDPERIALFNSSVQDAIARLISPFLTRQTRNKLTEAAESAAIDTFAANLRRLLLTAPVRGKTVMAIDPGASHGCKVGIVSPLGAPLHTGKVYLTDNAGRSRARINLIEWVRKFQCDVIAVGNGCFCRETEGFLSSLIQEGCFRPLDVSYVIVDEQGVSIYSCSPEAKKEFPDTEPTLISAVSLARRLQDPLAELVKVEPKHLGVGMYQHDVPEKKLTSSLEEVVSECVSFVGVDLNTASEHLLRRIAGLTQTRAAAIVQQRNSAGPFTSRQQLLKIRGLGSLTFRQCAGFVRIIPATAKTDATCALDPFDQTEIHPEDYKLAKKLLTEFALEANAVGSATFRDCLQRALAETSVGALAEAHGTSLLQMQQLVQALQKPLDHDLRSLSQQPLFRRGMTSLQSLKPGDLLSGVVRNVVAFGAFVDVGVGTSGLIHSSKLGYDRSRWVQLGDKVQVEVISVDLPRERLALKIHGR